MPRKIYKQLYTTRSNGWHIVVDLECVLRRGLTGHIRCLKEHISKIVEASGRNIVEKGK